MNSVSNCQISPCIKFDRKIRDQSCSSMYWIRGGVLTVCLGILGTLFV